MWLVLLSTCGFLTLVMSLAFCLCWKKKQSNSELNGIDGVVMRKNHDENVNHIPPADVTHIHDVNKEHGIENRTILQTTRRSLPDIPFEQEILNWDVQIDNSSEHYATVEQYQNSNKRHTLPNGLAIRPSTSQQSSLSQADVSPYEKVNYDKIKSRDHPYAQLQLATIRSNTIQSENVIGESGLSERIQPVYNETNDSGGSRRETNSDIPAASAVAGGIPASLELPYMTPPVLQTNFSGDSQDSSKGYTSISVREPLVNIMAQTKENTKRKDIDPHYSTVSDDSDDVYTTIPDPNQLCTNESETYARIPLTSIVVEAEIDQGTSNSNSDEIGIDVYQPDIQPIVSVADSMKHETKTPTQASAAIVHIGTPKPEKRQANSPLPLLPIVKCSDGTDKVLSPRNIEELYAKVQKTKTRCSSDEEKSSDSQVDIISTDSTLCIRDNNYSQVNVAEPSYEILGESHVKIKQEGYGYARINEFENLNNSDPGYEILKNISDVSPNRELESISFNALDPSSSRIEDNDILFGYSIVNKKKKDNTSRNCDGILCGNKKESISNELIRDCLCAKSNCLSSETDLNAVSHADPNYESVKYSSNPSHENVHTNSSISNSEISEHEHIISERHKDINYSPSPNSVRNEMGGDSSNQMEC